MTTINIHEAKTHFSKLIQAALEGEEVIIAKAGKPLVKLSPYSEHLKPRCGGQLKGLLEISDDFDADLPEKLLKQFYQADE